MIPLSSEPIPLPTDSPLFSTPEIMLLYPTRDAQYPSDRPLFRWQHTAQADTYKFTLQHDGEVIYKRQLAARDICFHDGICYYDSAVDEAFPLLEVGERYRWRVRESRSAVSSRWERFSPTALRQICPNPEPDDDCITPPPPVTPGATSVPPTQPPGSTPVPTSVPGSTPVPGGGCVPGYCVDSADDVIPHPDVWRSTDGVMTSAGFVQGDGLCTGQGTNEDLLDCSDQVYRSYYDMYVAQEGITPTITILLASVFTREFGSIRYASEDLVARAYRNNYRTVCSIQCDKAQLVWWLASKQGWYGVRSVNELLVSSSAKALAAAAQVFSSNWSNGGNAPRDWGNWAYSNNNNSPYQWIRSGVQMTEYKEVYQIWWDTNKDGKAKCNSQDNWTDYVFAIVTYDQDLQLPPTSTYSACRAPVSPRPNWLPADENQQVSKNPATLSEPPYWP